MNRIFGSSSQSKPKASLTDAIASTDARIDTIEVKLRKLEAELSRYKDQLKRLREGPGKAAVQKRALQVLKQKKMCGPAPEYATCVFSRRRGRYEGQIASLQQQTFNMESAALTTDNLRNTMATVDAMKQANKEMKKQYGKLDIDKIEVRPLPWPGEG
jgi:charged multivesicular body protein 5